MRKLQVEVFGETRVVTLQPVDAERVKFSRADVEWARERRPDSSRWTERARHDTLARAVWNATGEVEMSSICRADPVTSEPEPVVREDKPTWGAGLKMVTNVLAEKEGPARSQRGGKYSSKDADVRKMIDRKNNEEVERMLSERAERSDESG